MLKIALDHSWWDIISQIRQKRTSTRTWKRTNNHFYRRLWMVSAVHVLCVICTTTTRRGEGICKRDIVWCRNFWLVRSVCLFAVVMFTQDLNISSGSSGGAKNSNFVVRDYVCTRTTTRAWKWDAHFSRNIFSAKKAKVIRHWNVLLNGIILTSFIYDNTYRYRTVRNPFWVRYLY